MSDTLPIALRCEYHDWQGTRRGLSAHKNSHGDRGRNCQIVTHVLLRVADGTTATAKKQWRCEGYEECTDMEGALCVFTPSTNVTSHREGCGWVWVVSGKVS